MVVVSLYTSPIGRSTMQVDFHDTLLIWLTVDWVCLMVGVVVSPVVYQ